MIVAVAETFNPYRKWFGIPIKEQPVHYYRLLGLEPFEGDPDAIINAVDARVAFLKGQLSGARRCEAERLMDELAEVQAVLLDPAKKAAYDRQLQGLLPVRCPPRVGWAPVLPSTVAPSFLVRRGWVFLLPIFAAAVVVGCVVVLPFLMKTGEEAHQPAGKTAIASRRQPAAGTAGQTAATVRQTGPVSPLPTATEGHNPIIPAEKKGQSPREKPTEIAPPAAGEDSPAAPSAPAGVQIPAAEEQAREDMPFSPPSKAPKLNLPKEASPKTEITPAEEHQNEPAAVADSSPEESEDRPEIPLQDDRRKAEEAVQKVYGKRIAAAKSSREKLALAEEMWQEGVGAVGNAAERFVLWRLSLGLTADAGRLHEALTDAEKLEGEFPGDAAALKAAMVSRVVQAFRAGEKAANPFEIVAVSPAVIEEARLSGCFEEAGRLLQLVMPLARLSKDQNLIRDLATQSREIEKLKAQSASLRRAMDTLREHPDDAEARRLAGRWISFQLQDWKRGLSLLAKSSDPVLGKLAAQDLDNPQESARQAELAGGYWEAAHKEPEVLRRGILARAEYWYRKALPGLSEVAKIQVGKRLEEMEAERQSQKSLRGAVEPGNVALAKNGTRVEGVESGALFLLDGQSQFGAAASSPAPCQWTVTFRKLYQLQEIRFKLDERNPRNFFRYIVAVSADGENFRPVAIRTQGQWFGWQQVRIPSQSVKAVRLMGLSAGQSPRFMVDEFEAYCIAPMP
jgi:hypothetical protein